MLGGWSDSQSHESNPEVVQTLVTERSKAGLLRWELSGSRISEEAQVKGSQGPGCVWACAQGQQYEAYFHLRESTHTHKSHWSSDSPAFNVHESPGDPVESCKMGASRFCNSSHTMLICWSTEAALSHPLDGKAGNLDPQWNWAQEAIIDGSLIPAQFSLR